MDKKEFDEIVCNGTDEEIESFIIEAIIQYHKDNDMVWPYEWAKFCIDQVQMDRDNAIDDLMIQLVDESVFPEGREYRKAIRGTVDDYLAHHFLGNGVWVRALGKTMGEVTFVKKLHHDGGGYKVHVDVLHAEAIGVDRGDLVAITLKPAE